MATMFHCLFLFFRLTLLARQFCPKTRQANGECLERRKRVSIIHRESVVPYLPKLKQHGFAVTLFTGCNKLEVLNGGNRHPTMEIQAPTLQVFVPSWRFVFQKYNIRIIKCICLLIGLILVVRDFLQGRVRVWVCEEEARHSPWTF